MWILKTPMGEAAQDVIDQATQFIALEMEDYELEGSVVMISKKPSKTDATLRLLPGG